MKKKNNYEKLTSFIYDEMSWGPLFKKQTLGKREGKTIKNTDNNASDYIKDSLKIMKIPLKKLKGKKVFNIGTGRESRFFANHGAEVTHLDIGSKVVKELNDWAFRNKKKVNSINGDIAKTNIGENKYDIIFLAGIYQHLEIPALALIKFINSLKPGGLMYMGFYRSGEFKFFILDAIRHMLNKNSLILSSSKNKLKNKMLNFRDINSTLFLLSETNHYQSARIMDDFFVPKKHNFHPKDVIHDVKILKGKVFYFDNDFRSYSHEGKKYFSIGGDRIYITKNNKKIIKQSEVIKKLKTKEGRDQIFDVKYKEKIINENIKLIKKIRYYNDKGQISEINIACLCIGLYQFTRPFNFEKSYYYSLIMKNGRHKTLNLFLKNFIKNIILK